MLGETVKETPSLRIISILSSAIEIKRASIVCPFLSVQTRNGSSAERARPQTTANNQTNLFTPPTLPPSLGRSRLGPLDNKKAPAESKGLYAKLQLLRYQVIDAFRVGQRPIWKDVPELLARALCDPLNGPVVPVYDACGVPGVLPAQAAVRGLSWVSM